MNVLEKEFEEIFFNALSTPKLLIERGFYGFEKKYYRQPSLGKYGIPDIVGVSVHRVFDGRVLNITVYELKKEQINVSTLLQAARYIRGIQVLFEDLMGDLFSYTNYKIVCIGKSIETSSDFIYMADFCSNLSLYTYKIDLIKGLTLESHDGYFIPSIDPINTSLYVSDAKKGNLHKNNPPICSFY